jgi:hypothetical protein
VAHHLDKRLVVGAKFRCHHKFGVGDVSNDTVADHAGVGILISPLDLVSELLGLKKPPL